MDSGKPFRVWDGEKSDLLGISLFRDESRLPDRGRVHGIIQIEATTQQFRRVRVGVGQFVIHAELTNCSTTPVAKAGLSQPVQVKTAETASRKSSSAVEAGLTDAAGGTASSKLGASSSGSSSVETTFSAEAYKLVVGPAGRTPRWTVSALPPGNILHENLDLPVVFELGHDAVAHLCELTVDRRSLSAVALGTFTPVPLAVKLIALAMLGLRGESKKEVSAMVEFV